MLIERGLARTLGGKLASRRPRLRIGETLERLFDRRALSLLVAAIVALVVFPSTLCVGNDGHVALEASLAGHCVSADVAPQAGGNNAGLAGATSLPPCCGPCTDISAYVASSRAGNDADLDQLSSASAVPFALDTARTLAPALTAFRLSARATASASRASARRSTILRC